MNQLIKKYNYLRIILNTIFYLILFAICISISIKMGFLEWLELDFFQFQIKLLTLAGLLTIALYIPYIISIIMHEVGHLLFGIKAKLEFVSFSVLNITIAKKNNHIIVKKNPIIIGILGYCIMNFNENHHYHKQEVISYWLGGIILNTILLVIFTIIYIFNNNSYLEIIFLMFIIINIYFIFNNLIPTVTKTGACTDGLHLYNYLNDSQYIKVVSKCTKIQNLILNGQKLEELDEHLFFMPNKIQNFSEITMAMLYIDYISAKERYNEAINHIERILNQNDDILTKQHINTLKIQLLNCVFYGDYDDKIIKKYWDEDVKKQLEIMGNVDPELSAINYMFYSFVEKNHEKTERILKDFNKIKKKYPDKIAVKKAEEIIADVNKKKNGKI